MLVLSEWDRMLWCCLKLWPGFHFQAASEASMYWRWSKPACSLQVEGCCKTGQLLASFCRRATVLASIFQMNLRYLWEEASDLVFDLLHGMPAQARCLLFWCYRDDVVPHAVGKRSGPIMELIDRVDGLFSLIHGSQNICIWEGGHGMPTLKPTLKQQEVASWEVLVQMEQPWTLWQVGPKVHAELEAQLKQKWWPSEDVREWKSLGAEHFNGDAGEFCIAIRAWWVAMVSTVKSMPDRSCSGLAWAISCCYPNYNMVVGCQSFGSLITVIKSAIKIDISLAWSSDLVANPSGVSVAVEKAQRACFVAWLDWWEDNLFAFLLGSWCCCLYLVNNTSICDQWHPTVLYYHSGRGLHLGA
ncbi:hypothetical protein EDD16DRAFT_1527439 [Pisolithus croceorrhizus]|nr:hypothetical protein EV401DRAFT_1895644 [Pisolithus croceorrhizus]KAI6097929.1 hypothetical protein EDD16DRAFT_1527439 [Pisolithus croceorrhizus]